MLEQPDAFAERHGHQVNLYFVKQSGSYALLSDTRAASHSDIFITRSCLGFLKDTLDTVGDEGKRLLFPGNML